VPISCIQHPETGRELSFDKLQPAAVKRRILVAGGGPGGMKAAAVASARGHAVTLCESGSRLGGQTLLAQLLPGRAEYGGIVTNLEREMLKTTVDRALVESENADVVIVATGASPNLPSLEGDDEGHVVSAWDVLTGEANVGTNVVIADWRCDWIGYGIAEKLALDGCRVRLAVNGTQAGEEVVQYIRDHAAGRLFSLGVEVLPYARLYGLDADSVYFEHTMAREPMVCNDVDTLVLALGHLPNEELAEELAATGIETHCIGDCLSPRTAEEAVFEGLKVACDL
jgi:pyruvate/2-oxoglutarate dehydrogenase complex dihydrolipoamide dehydrogenase (E3) component